MWPSMFVLISGTLLSTSVLVPWPEDGQTAALDSLLTELLPQLSSCLVLVFPSSSSYLHLVQEEQAIRVQLDSPYLQQALLASYLMGCSGYVTDSASGWRMLSALGEARLKAMERQTPRILVLPSNDILDSRGACEILKHHEAAYIPDILLVEHQGELSSNPSEISFRLLTNNFGGNKENGSQDCTPLGTWPVDDIHFSQDKTADLQGKELVVFSVDYPPYTLLKPGLPFEGTEARFIKEFCKKYNCSLRLVTDDDLWGEIFGNGTGIGMSGSVYMDEVDLGIGAFGAWLEEHSYVDYSFPYVTTTVAVLVPKPARLPDWSIPVLPFTPTLWALQAASVILAAIALALLNKLTSHFTSEAALGGEFASFGGVLLRTVAMAVLQPPPALSPNSPLRRFFVIFEVLCLFFTTIYSGALSSVLTVPVYYPPIDSPQELYASGIPWAADHEAWTFSIKEAPEPYLQGLVARFESHDTEELIRLAKKGGYGFSVELMPGGHVAQMDHLSGEMVLGLHVMKNQLYSTSIVFLFRKGSPFTEKINSLLMRCLDTGLFLLWETDVTLTYLSSRLQTALKISEGSRVVDEQEPTQLRVVHVQGAFFMLALGLALASLVFVVETINFARKDLSPRDTTLDSNPRLT